MHWPEGPALTGEGPAAAGLLWEGEARPLLFAARSSRSGDSPMSPALCERARDRLGRSAARAPSAPGWLCGQMQ